MNTATKTIEVTQQDGKLIAHCQVDQTLDSNVIDWRGAITAGSDCWEIAHKVTEINGAEIVSVDHDGDTVFVYVSAAIQE